MTTLNCKQGDLAVIIRARNHENIGKIVEVVRPYVKGERILDITGKRGGRVNDALFHSAIWVIRSHGSPMVWANHNNELRNALFYERAFSDAGLRPIPKLDEPEDVTTEKELTV